MRLVTIQSFLDRSQASGLRNDVGNVALGENLRSLGGGGVMLWLTNHARTHLHRVFDRGAHGIIPAPVIWSIRVFFLIDSACPRVLRTHGPFDQDVSTLYSKVFNKASSRITNSRDIYYKSILLVILHLGDHLNSF